MERYTKDIHSARQLRALQVSSLYRCDAYDNCKQSRMSGRDRSDLKS